MHHLYFGEPTLEIGSKICQKSLLDGRLAVTKALCIVVSSRETYVYASQIRAILIGCHSWETRLCPTASNARSLCTRSLERNTNTGTAYRYDLAVNGSSFHLKPWQRILPLPVLISGSGNASYADWICHHPTMTWRPLCSPPRDPEAVPRIDNLVIYHIHHAPLPRLPPGWKSMLTGNSNGGDGSKVSS